MDKYRKKPVVIEALQFKETNHKEVKEFCPSIVYIDALNAFIPTLEGDMKVIDGDFIIKGIKGEFYPCKPDIFEATYELEIADFPPVPLNEAGIPEHYIP